VVGSVEELETELKAVPFQNRPVLHERRVHVEAGRALDHVAATVAEGSAVTCGKRSGVVVLLRPVGPPVFTNIEGHSRDTVGSVAGAGLNAASAFVQLAIGSIAVTGTDVELRARLPGDDGANVTGVPPALPGWQ
jgi:hypothetical protein